MDEKKLLERIKKSFDKVKTEMEDLDRRLTALEKDG